MTMRSRTSAVTAALVGAVLLTVTACGSSSTAANAAPQAITPDMTATLNLWTYEPQTAGTATDAEAQVAAFKKLYPNVDVKVTFIPEAQFSNKVIASGTTKSGPDVLWVNGAFTQSYAEAKVVASLTPYLKTYADAAQFPASVISTFQNESYSIQTYVNLNALWYNKTILDQYKLPVPTTLDQMQSDMATIAAAGKYAGLQIAGTTGVEGEWISKPFFSAFGVTDYKKYGSDGTQKMFNLLTDWTSKGYIAKANVGLSQTDGVQKFIEGGTAFYVGGNWQLGLAAKVPFKLGVVGMPAGPAGPGTVYLGGQAESIGAFSKNTDLAWKFLETTWLTKSFETTKLAQGSIPARKDALPANVDPNVKAYATALTKGVALSSDTASTLAVGNLWSGVLSGQSSPDAGEKIAAQIAQTAK